MNDRQRLAHPYCYEKPARQSKGFLEDLQVALFDGSVAEGKALVSSMKPAAR
ncbi:MAG: hypothetical protein L0Y58_12310 [Verrucomicrobia subdivision 3 bacterium]|nr:hypothetical protein [Limisphaerales bacterium]